MHRSLGFYDPLPEFCSYCGNTLDAVNLVDGFDIYTGEQKTTEFLRCEKGKLQFDKHDIWRVAEDAPFTPLTFADIAQFTPPTKSIK